MIKGKNCIKTFLLKNFVKDYLSRFNKVLKVETENRMKKEEKNKGKQKIVCD